MAKREGKEKQKRLVVSMRHVTTPDAEGRLSLTIDILLRVAARGTTKSEDSINTEKETPPSRGPAGDSLSSGEEGDPHE